MIEDRGGLNVTDSMYNNLLFGNWTKRKKRKPWRCYDGAATMVWWYDGDGAMAMVRWRCYYGDGTIVRWRWYDDHRTSMVAMIRWRRYDGDCTYLYMKQQLRIQEQVFKYQCILLLFGGKPNTIRQSTRVILQYRYFKTIYSSILYGWVLHFNVFHLFDAYIIIVLVK